MEKKMFQKLLKGIIQNRQKDREADIYHSLLQAEARIGGEVFGPIPSGHRRESFCLDSHTWIWHEEWQDENGKTNVLSTKYQVRPGQGILKSQNDQNYQYLTEDELTNLYQATQLYKQIIRQKVYSFI